MKRVIRSSINTEIWYRGYQILKNGEGSYDVFFRDDVSETGFKDIETAKLWIDKSSGDNITVYKKCRIIGTPEGYTIDDPSGEVITRYTFETLQDAKDEIDDQLNW